MTVAWQPKPLDLPAKEADEPETTGENSTLRIAMNSPDPTLSQTLRAVELSGVLDFWDDPAEDIYTADDGEPL